MSTFKADYIIARQEEISGNTSSIPVKTVVNGTPKSWVNFNGTGTIATRGSFNVASLTDNGVGDYTVNMATALLDANYAINGSSGGNNATTNGAVYAYDQGTARTTTAYRIIITNSAGGVVDCSQISPAAIR